MADSWINKMFSVFYRCLNYFFLYFLQLKTLSGVWHAESSPHFPEYCTRKVVSFRIPFVFFWLNITGGAQVGATSRLGCKRRTVQCYSFKKDPNKYLQPPGNYTRRLQKRFLYDPIFLPSNHKPSHVPINHRWFLNKY